MTYNQYTLLELLSASIFNKGTIIKIDRRINWVDLFNESMKHQIAPLIYTHIKNYIIGEKPCEELMNRWKTSTIISNLRQSMNSIQMTYVFKELYDNNIEYIPFKGVILKDLYPDKDSRTMNDVDILIHKEDSEKIKEILSKLGYHQSENSVIHTSFIHQKHLTIEMHWSLINKEFIKNSNVIDSSAWGNRVNSVYSDVPIQILSPEDQLLHICTHMAAHFVCGGFGLRQICDFALFVENKRDIIQWSSYNQKTIEVGINRFVYALFEVCNIAFGINIPAEIFSIHEKSEDVAYKLIDEIFKSGVFGGANVNQIVKNTALQYHRRGKIKNKFTKLSFLLALLFPSINVYSDKYKYTKKWPVLIPVFWIHHLFSGILKREFSLKEKFISLYNAPHEAKLRLDLLQKLDLL